MYGDKKSLIVPAIARAHDIHGDIHGGSQVVTPTYTPQITSHLKAAAATTDGKALEFSTHPADLPRITPVGRLLRRLCQLHGCVFVSVHPHTRGELAALVPMITPAPARPVE